MSTAEEALRVAHLDADAFYVSIELRRHPELRGRPVIVAGSGPRAVVTTASYEARRYGVGSAMPASRARRLCPDAVVLAPDFATYREASKQVMDLVRAHVERVEVVGLDEAYLDVAGLFSPRAAMRRLVAEIKDATELTCSVGIGPNKLVAKVASDAEKPAGFVVLEPRAGVRALRLGAAGARAWHRPEDRGAARRAGPDDAARHSAPRPSELLVERFGANLGRELGTPRALRTRRRDRRCAQGRLRVARAHLRHRPQRSDADARAAVADGRGAVRRARRSSAPRAHDRDQGAPRRLDDGHPRAHHRRADLRCRAGQRDRAGAAARLRARAAGASARRARRRSRRRGRCARAPASPARARAAPAMAATPPTSWRCPYRIAS